jgi:tRNA pseudouridine32 synthase/23S rRNA pseudouridine746 synthase/23S rRNA pseudouridine1911/1915/1917 synthase
MKLIDALALTHRDVSKTKLRKWLEFGRICVNGSVCKIGSQEVSERDSITLETKKISLPLDLEILYQDSDVIVVFKPKGLLSVATETSLFENVHTILKDALSPSRVFPVHRLDKETSGVLVFALNEKARDHLKDQFFKHTIEREYIAIVEGVMKEDKGTFTSYLYDDKNYHVHASPTPNGGKHAITHYEVLARSKNFTKLKIKLETGRKNQIRVQCAEKGHPVAGDLKYGAKTEHLGGLALHAELLAFTHPTSQKRKSFRVPPSRAIDLFMKKL